MMVWSNSPVVTAASATVVVVMRLREHGRPYSKGEVARRNPQGVGMIIIASITASPLRDIIFFFMCIGD